MILELFWFFLPAGVANIVPRLVSKINFLGNPINEKLFGSHKTWRGLIFGVLAAIIFVFIQKLIGWDSIVDYSSVNVILLGFLLGFGGIFGDVIKSYFKRRVGIAPGKSWIPFDQIDFVLGGLVFVFWYVDLSVIQALIIFLMYSLLHPIVNYIAYLLKIQKNKL